MSQPLYENGDLTTCYALVMRLTSKLFHAGHLGVMNGQAQLDRDRDWETVLVNR